MNKLNILIIEDESLVAMELQQAIEKMGHTVVEYATNVKMAKKFFEEFEIDLLLMDINLNDSLDGIELYKNLEMKVPIIYLTAYTDEETMSQAIQTNPVGYLIKPHTEDELKAIIKLAQYKIQNVDKVPQKIEKLIKIGKGYFFDTDEEQLFYKDLPVKLTLKERGLLKILIQANGKIVKFDTIESELWHGESVNNTSLRTLIYRLRSKLEHKLIESEFNVGIRLVSL
jgi:DNA-binding response OmpR family regulator